MIGRNIYFIGIGGIGMSALARYFRHEGWGVAGYDLTETVLTRALESEGIDVHYVDDPSLIPGPFRDPAATLVVFTPAVPGDHAEMLWFFERGFVIEKRSEMLGHVSEGKFMMAVAGTHGKTTTTTLVAWLNRCLTGGGSAFLGGISKNFGSNLVLDGQGFPPGEPAGGLHGRERITSGGLEGGGGPADSLVGPELSAPPQPPKGGADDFAEVGKSQSANIGSSTAPSKGETNLGEFSPAAKGRRRADELLQSSGQQRLAVEADEFDRSFLRLSPNVALITGVDADHLDIYGTYDAVREAFSQFADRIVEGGALVVNTKVDIELRNTGIRVYTYSLDDPAADFHVRPGAGGGDDLVTPDGVIEDVRMGIPGRVNLENAVGAVAMVMIANHLSPPPPQGAEMRVFKENSETIRAALATFKGVRRRFDVWVDTPRGVYMDDYAHHPEELAAALGSLRAMYAGRKITAIFQPHLYTRTRDFAEEFGRALSGADEVILTPIYPAREQPIEGVASELIGASVTVPWRVVEKEDLARTLRGMATDVVVTFGAGNIENCCAEIAAVVAGKIES